MPQEIVSTETLTAESILPPILAGQQTPVVAKKVERFYLSLEETLEAWITRRSSPHTQRAYRQDIESLLRFLRVAWPQ